MLTLPSSHAPASLPPPVRPATLERVSTQRVFVARLSGCSVFDPAGDRLGKVRDVVVIYRKDDPPRVVGLVVEIPGRRHVFVSIGRVTSIATGQVITTGLINVRRFQQRGGEVRVIAELLGRRVHLIDGIGARRHRRRRDRAQPPRRVGRRAAVPAPPAHERVALREGPDDLRRMEGGARGPGSRASRSRPSSWSPRTPTCKPADLANTLLDLPDERMIEVAEELSDERLADALEEMPEEEQVHILEQLGDERAADILDAMEPDDAADLLGQLPEQRSEELLDLMEPEEADDVRALLQYGPDTAGGLMTSEPIVLSADATVAEALALIRRHELHPALAAAVFVTLPPYETPTGRLLGTVHFQRMLRYPPHERLGAIIDDTLEPVRATATAAEVARMLASYNLVSLPGRSTRRSASSARSASTTCSTTCCPTTGARTTTHASPARARRAPRGDPEEALMAPPVAADLARRAPRAHRACCSARRSRRATGSAASPRRSRAAMGTSGFLLGMTVFVVGGSAGTSGCRPSASSTRRRRTSRC